MIIFLVTLLVRLLRAACKSRDELVLENLAVRQQVTAVRLGFDVSETTVSRYVRRFREHNPDPDLLKQWISFLRNHTAIAGMDLFTVPTATLNVLYGFFVIHHDRRCILHFNETYHPTAQWVMQQLREAFPFDSTTRHLIFDRDSIFCPALAEFVKVLGVKPRRIAYWSP